MYVRILAALILLGSVYAAQAFGPGAGNRTGREGAFKKNGSGGAGTGCTGNLVLNYSNSCNLMSQMVGN